jgi:tetratricopeptide (TPR) repeat protein
MKRLITLLFILTATLKLSAHASDLDSLKQKLQVTGDSLKGPIYTQIAAYYLNYDTVSTRRMKYYFQTEALNYTMLALHNYSSYNDTLGLRTSFNALAKVYRSQRKFSQAKWFILQSNTISRQIKDTLNIINSLIELAAIKSDIKDYKLSKKDLNDALALSLKTHDPKKESVVQVGYAELYRKMNDYDKAAEAIKRHEFLEDSLNHVTIDSIAKVAAADSMKIKKQDSAIAKKKVYTSNSRRRPMLKYARHITSLSFSPVPLLFSSL